MEPRENSCLFHEKWDRLVFQATWSFTLWGDLGKKRLKRFEKLSDYTKSKILLMSLSLLLCVKLKVS